MDIRTDLALERRDMAASGELRGVISSERENRDCRATVIEIISEEGEKKIGKPMGKYITLETESFPDITELSDGRLSMLTEFISSLVPEEGDILAVCLGNSMITPDALGPLCGKSILATRHMDEETKKLLKLPPLRNVSVLTPGVTGKTGIETLEIISGTAEKIKPAAVIAVDALAAGSIKRLGTTIQLSDTGISPGSGVGNRRKAIDSRLLGVPVIAIGVPTVVDAGFLASEISGNENISRDFGNMTLTPKDIDIIISGAARLLALGINCALQKNLTREEIISLTLQ